MSLLINCSTLEGRKAKDDHPHFSDWETQEAINGLQKIIDPASGRPETLPRTSDSKSCASSLLNSEKRLLLIKKTLKSGLGVFRGWPKKTRKYTLPGEDSSLPAHSPGAPSQPSGLAPEAQGSRPEIARSPGWPPLSTVSYPLGRKRGPQVPAQYLLKHRKGTAPSQRVSKESTQSKHGAQRRKKGSETVLRNPRAAGVEGREPATRHVRRKIPVTKGESKLVPRVDGDVEATSPRLECGGREGQVRETTRYPGRLSCPHPPPPPSSSSSARASETCARPRLRPQRCAAFWGL